jgi:hypothetical protein
MRQVKNLLFILLFSLPVFPWGRVGHSTVAYIAEKNLSPATLAKIKPYLEGESIEDVAVWADQYKESHRSTGPWHYIDLPTQQLVTVADIPHYCDQDKHPGGDVVSQIKKDINDLKSPKASFKEKQYALWFLIHFIGDVHMPLHASDDSDAGGNDKKVRFFSPASRSNKGHVTNLHSLWDNLIEIKAAEDPVQFGEELNGEISAPEKQKWESGTIEDWTIESYMVAKNVIYQELPAASGNVIVLPRDYYSRMRPVVEEQIKKAGVRLARVLEEILGK